MESMVSQMSLTAILVFLAVPAAGFWFVRLASKGALVRCPEAGAIALVEFDARRDQAQACSARAAVLRCDLWPRRSACARACAARDGIVAAP